MRTARLALLASILIAGVGRGAEPLTIQTAAEPPEISPDEPLAPEFSLELAARNLDNTALHWQREYQCAACHTLPPYLMARPLLSSVAPEPPEVREFFERIVNERLEGEPALPKDGISAIIVETAAALAFHDRRTTGTLHPTTRTQLDRMWTFQRADGSWEWPFRDVPPIKSDEHYGVTMAALATGAAPDGYAATDAARHGLDNIRRYLAANPAYSLHQQSMLLWAGTLVDDLAAGFDPARTIEALRAAQGPDGGWSLASLTENTGDPDRQTEEGQSHRAADGHGRDFLVYVGRDKAYRSSLASDGYATGFTVFVLRQAGVPADDPAIRRGAAWIKSHQRASGRWFTPAQSWSTQDYIANAGNAYVIMALDECGEVTSGQ
ncbi:MAG: squalene--hopene cyclase [Planctomycetaceae bacterium]|nr:squalene--hopene cyclase [Planctomycetaceae bacterium]